VSAIPDSARHEIKFVAEGLRHRELEARVRLHPDGFREAYPPRQVNNLYFDDPRYFTFQENLVGASARSKVRLRWYGDTVHPRSGVLEVKRKRNQLGWKLSFPIGAVELDKDSWLEIRRKLRAELGDSARTWLDAAPQPVLINRYLRQYFESPGGRVRLTLDREQRVFDQRFSSRPNLTRRANLPDSVVVELKFAPADRALAAQAVQGLPLRLSRNSKYVIGVRSLLSS
jgi:hypothetical protein